MAILEGRLALRGGGGQGLLALVGTLGAFGSRGYSRGAFGSQRVWRSGAFGSPAVGSLGDSRGFWLSWGVQGLLAIVGSPGAAGSTVHFTEVSGAYNNF